MPQIITVGVIKFQKGLCFQLRKGLGKTIDLVLLWMMMMII